MNILRRVSNAIRNRFGTRTANTRKTASSGRSSG